MTQAKLSASQRQTDILVGVVDIANYEQNVTLQAVINQDPTDFADVTTGVPNFLFPVDSGIPGELFDDSFTYWCSHAGSSLVGSNYSFASGIDRFDWFYSDLLPLWTTWRATNYNIDLQELLGGYHNDD